MACGKTVGDLGAFQRVTVVSSSDSQFFPTTDWMVCTGAQVRIWLNVLDEGGSGIQAKPAIQYAQVVTDQPSGNGGRGDWAGSGTFVTTEGIHAFGDMNLSNNMQYFRLGFEARAGGGSIGQADISLLAQVKPCGKLVGSFNAAGIEADATREIPVSEWFPTVDVSNLRIGYLLDADSAFKVDWYIQTANDTSRPAQPATLGLSQVSGSGAGTYVSGNTGDVDISSVTSPGTATNTPAWARIVARISTAGGAVSADQLVVDVQVS